MDRDTLIVILVVLTALHLLAGIFFVLIGSNYYLINLTAILINLFVLSALKEE